MARWFDRWRKKRPTEVDDPRDKPQVAEEGQHEEATPVREEPAKKPTIEIVHGEAEEVIETPEEPQTRSEARPDGDSDSPSGTADQEEATEASEPSAEAKAARGLFARLRAGLSRTREGMTERIAQLVSGRTAVTEELFEELEEILIQADVGVPTTMRIVDGVRERFAKSRSKDPADLSAFVAEEMRSLLSVGNSELAKPDGSPKVYMVVGVNGAGKTTTIGKLAARFKAEGKNVLLGAGDTFRAAAIDQLAVWAERAGVDLIRHQEGSDPAAVAYDAVHAAKARKSDLLILDTAGRLQNKVNLMRELAKVYRVIEREWGAPPDETLLVIDANTGQNGLSQARLFMDATPLTGVVLTKLDSTSKGGIVLAIASEIGIPVKLIGVGEAIDDLRDFDPDEFIRALFPGLSANGAGRD